MWQARTEPDMHIQFRLLTSLFQLSEIDPSCFLFLSQQYLDYSFLFIVSAEQNRQASIFPQQLCHSLPQTFLTFAVVQNPCQPHSKAMPNLQFDGNATIN